SWHTPGGGIHRGESPAAGACREIQEEVGMTVKPEQLIPLFHKRVVTRRRFRYDCHAFALIVSTKPKLSLQQEEIIDAAWLPLADLRRQAAGRVTNEMLDAWERQV